MKSVNSIHANSKKNKIVITQNIKIQQESL